MAWLQANKPDYQTFDDIQLQLEYNNYLDMNPSAATGNIVTAGTGDLPKQTGNYQVAAADGKNNLDVLSRYTFMTVNDQLGNRIKINIPVFDTDKLTPDMLDAMYHYMSYENPWTGEADYVANNPDLLKSLKIAAFDAAFMA